MLARRSLLSGAIAPLLAAQKSATGFALIGDRYHNSDYIRVALSRTLVRELGVSIDFTDETRELTAARLKRHKLLITLRDGFIWPDGYPDESTNAAWVNTGKPKIVSDPPMPVPAAKPDRKGWITPEQGRAVRRFVEDGGAALFLHNSTYIAPYNEDFRHTLGAVTANHPPIRPFKVEVTNPDHPITRGVRDFVVTDEQHYVKYEKDPMHVFLQSVNEDGLTFAGLGASCEAGWAYDYGKGRVCYMAPGHLLTALWNPEYVKLQQNAVRWLLRQS